MAAVALDEVERLLGNPALLAVGDGHFAPFLEAAVEYFDLTSLVKDEEVVAILGRSTLDGHGRSGNDAARMNLFEVLLLQGADVGKDGDKQQKNCR